MESQQGAEIRFGAPTHPVRVPVGVRAAVTETKKITFRQVHACGNTVEAKKGSKATPAKVTAAKEQLMCPACGVLVNKDELLAGYEYTKGKFVTFTADEIEETKGVKSPVITITKFVPIAQITRLMKDTSHFLIPNPVMEDWYATLYQAMAKAKAAGIGSHSLWGTQKPCVIYAETGFETGGVLMLESLHLWEDMARPDFSAPIPEKADEKIANTIIKQSLGTLTAEDLVSPQRVRLDAMIKAKAKGKKVPAAADEPVLVGEEPGDLTEALRLSLEAMTKA